MRSIVFAALVCALAPAAFAEDAMQGMDHGAMHGTAAAAPGPFDAVTQKMHEAMTEPPSGNVDIDFARGMIAHHEGAIGMAKIELEQGSDPEMRALAEAVIAAQEKEITDMQAWLAAHGG
jgi:uncharacterized protein (DUF305 family)